MAKVGKPALPKDKVKSRMAIIRLTEAEHTALFRLAKNEGLNTSQFLRKVVREWARNKQRTKGLGELF